MTAAVDPFGEGLPRPAVLRLLSGRFDREDLAAYYETAHFQRLREEVIEVYGSCCLCGCRYRKRLTCHHRHYRTLCLDCCAGSAHEVRLCPVTACPLWPYRTGHNPARTGIGPKAPTQARP